MNVEGSSLFPAWLINSAVVVAIVSLIGLIIRQVGPWRRQITEAEERLRNELMENNSRCEAELRIMRHRDRNSRQMIYSMLHIMDMPLEQRGAALDKIRVDLERMEKVEAAEIGSFLAGVTTE